ncbi:MAG: type II toxin-antitoxin system RelE/ParE family toxin [Thermomicrobiales bacterium]
MTHKYQWSPQARTEMQLALRESKHRWGVEQRDAYRRRVSDVVKSISQNPEMGMVRPRWGQGMRSFIVGAHVLVYSVEDSVVIILRVLHQHEDLERALGLRREDAFD